jgi:hypothetical protein
MLIVAVFTITSLIIRYIVFIKMKYETTTNLTLINLSFKSFFSKKVWKYRVEQTLLDPAIKRHDHRQSGPD